MSITPFQVALWIELLAAGLGGLQGALFAAGQRYRRIDVLGVVVIGLAMSLGGGLLRDIVLVQPPVVIWMNWYLPVAAASAILGMSLQPVLARVDWLITVLDALVMGLFGAIGASKALSLGVGEVGALVVGVIGAIGGGMLRDVLLSLPISFLHVGTLYAIAAAAGAGTLIVLVAFATPVAIAGLVCVVTTTAVRLAAVHFGWTFPEQRSLRARRQKAPSPPTAPAGTTQREEPEMSYAPQPLAERAIESMNRADGAAIDDGPPGDESHRFRFVLAEQQIRSMSANMR